MEALDFNLPKLPRKRKKEKKKYIRRGLNPDGTKYQYTYRVPKKVGWYRYKSHEGVYMVVEVVRREHFYNLRAIVNGKEVSTRMMHGKWCTIKVHF